MSPRIRKFLGGAIMLMFVVFYALVAMALADSRPMQEAPDWLRVIVYAVLGLAWIVPLMPLFRWMENNPRRARG